MYVGVFMRVQVCVCCTHVLVCIYKDHHRVLISGVTDWFLRQGLLLEPEACQSGPSLHLKN